jgi:hypothetical protein
LSQRFSSTRNEAEKIFRDLEECWSIPSFTRDFWQAMLLEIDGMFFGKKRFLAIKKRFSRSREGVRDVFLSSLDSSLVKEI